MKIQSPWMGRVRGSAGNMTGSKVYDKNVMRAKAFEVSNPNTQAQQTERSFFAEVSQCVASVSEAELRSLFGVKPKGMSRRNALTKQVSEAYSIDGNSKTLDFSKLLSIGNGEKIDVEILHGDSDTMNLFFDFANNPGLQQMPVGANLILVFFIVETQTIMLKNTQFVKTEGDVDFDLAGEFPGLGEIYVYPTYSTDGSNVYLKGFGSFIIKTRAEKK